MFYIKIQHLLSLLILTLLIACGGQSDSTKESAPKKAKAKSMIAKKTDPMDNIGVGPITTAMVLDKEVDTEMATKGNELYKTKCTACHKIKKKFIGPSPVGILDRRSPSWIMNMILDPEKMVKEDPIAKNLLMEYNGSPMANQSLTEEEARAILEYFRTI